MFDDPGGKIKNDGPQTSHDADQYGQAEQSRLRANTASVEKKEFRE